VDLEVRHVPCCAADLSPAYIPNATVLNTPYAEAPIVVPVRQNALLASAGVLRGHEVLLGRMSRVARQPAASGAVPPLSLSLRDDGSMPAAQTPDGQTLVTLREITPDNRAAVESLRVSSEQESYVDGVARSLAEAAATPASRPWCRAVYAGEHPVGFVMVADDAPPEDPVIPWRYYLWRMLIDERHQGQGLGRAALDLVAAYLRTRPGAETLMTSVVPGPGSPLGFYLRYGFEPTGEWFDHEQVIGLPLDR